MPRVGIKICGITNVRDACACAEFGVNMIGLNFYLGSARCIKPEVAGEIVEAIPSSVQCVGVFVDPTIHEVQKTAKVAGIRCVQLHGEISPDSCRKLARDFHVIRAFHTGDGFQPEDVTSFAVFDILLDAHHPKLRGGTGLTCDWSAARATLPFARFLILSGGLSAQNVNHAITSVTPHAVDVCSGVESTPGVKDHDAIKDFIATVRTAERSLQTTRL